MVLIQEKTFNAETDTWSLIAVVTLPDGNRTGSYVVQAPQDATDEQLEVLLVDMFNPVP